MRKRVLALAGAAVLAASGAKASETFKDWWVTCDNTRDCAAYGFEGEPAEMAGYLKLVRGAAADAAPRVRIVVETAAGLWRLTVDGEPVAGLGAVRATSEPDANAHADLSSAESAALISAIANGAALEVAAPGQPAARISLAGSSAAFRWMDDQQKRVGTVTALVAKGPKPAAAVPAPPALPLVRAAAPASQAGLGSKPPRAVLSQMQDCDDDIGELGVDPVVGRLSPGLVMWAPACTRGAYNMIYSFFLFDEKTRAARPLSIAYPGGDKPVSELMNADYDPKTQTLSNFDKGRGLGDCGALNTWVWDGKAFVPTAQELMGECRGVPPEDWATSYRSR